ncbi:unnamed protein product [Chironomus riparius]|uniref:Uncharacterized protein n=1 Tax=Chironomus riparius TaxID=315576 RepID=A0A9N9RN31_9DIPT|nr:unnamed protein product [Chironomus riparius]
MKLIKVFLIIGSISLAQSAPSIWSHLSHNRGMRGAHHLSELRKFENIVSSKMNDEDKCQQCMEEKYESLQNNDLNEIENFFVFMYFLNTCNDCTAENFYEDVLRNLIFEMKQEIEYEEKMIGGYEKFSCGVINRTNLKAFVLDMINLVFEEDDDEKNAGIEKIAGETESAIDNIGKCVYDRKSAF